LALNKSVEVTSTHGGANGSMTGQMAVDGNVGTFWHSTGGTNSITIDLGSVMDIERIQIENRAGSGVYNGVAANARMSGGNATITIYGDDKTTVIKETPELSTVANTYTIDLTAENPVWV